MHNNAVKEAIAYYHHLIASDFNAAEEQLKALMQMQVDRKASFGGRPLAASLRPTLIGDSTYTQIQDTVYLIRQATLKITATFFNSKEALDELGMTETEIKLAAIPTNVIRLSATARFDAFMTQDSFKFVEINAESPAGGGYSHTLAKIYRELPIFKKFEERFPIRVVSPLEHLVHGLLRIYHEEFDGKVERPSFAIVDFLNVPTYNEFELVKEYLERHGYPCEIIDPRNLEIKEGWIYANGRKIDILYRRLLTNEFIEVMDDCPAFMEGYRQQKTCYLNTFRSKLVHKKSIFAFLTDPEYTKVLNPVQLQAIRQHIPWTRKMREQKTIYRGRMIDLLEMVHANKNNFVIKPNDEYGGKGVYIGPDCTDAQWHEAITIGVKDGYVVQELVEIHREEFLVKQESGWKEVPTVVDMAPYLYGPLMGGCLTRTSISNLANVTSGGGTLPLFILRYL